MPVGTRMVPTALERCTGHLIRFFTTGPSKMLSTPIPEMPEILDAAKATDTGDRQIREEGHATLSRGRASGRWGVSAAARPGVAHASGVVPCVMQVNLLD